MTWSHCRHIIREHGWTGSTDGHRPRRTRVIHEIRCVVVNLNFGRHELIREHGWTPPEADSAQLSLAIPAISVAAHPMILSGTKYLSISFRK